MKNKYVQCLIIFVAFVMIFIGFSCVSDKKPKPDPNIAPAYAVTSEPQFKKEGTLRFMKEDQVLSSIDIELADTEAKHIQGMMHRRSMEENHGMLFIFDQEKRQSFWMINTHIALDIIFVNEAKRIVHIAPNCKPYSSDGIPSYEYAKFAIEVNGGYCSRHAIKVGQYIDL